MSSQTYFLIRTGLAAIVAASFASFASAQSLRTDTVNSYMDAASALGEAIDRKQFDREALALALALDGHDGIAAIAL